MCECVCQSFRMHFAFSSLAFLFDMAIDFRHMSLHDQCLATARWSRVLFLIKIISPTECGLYSFVVSFFTPLIIRRRFAMCTFFCHCAHSYKYLQLEFRLSTFQHAAFSIIYIVLRSELTKTRKNYGVALFFFHDTFVLPTHGVHVEINLLVYSSKMPIQFHFNFRKREKNAKGRAQEQETSFNGTLQ